ncbi:MAG: protease inhibitor I42 family protein [Mycobacterium leprae]
MKLTAADANTTRTVSVGNEVIVQLPETPTTGYQWRPEVDSDALQIIGDQYEVVETPRGAPGLHVFAFRAIREGPTVLKLVRGRAWESRTIDEYRVNLRILD